MKNSRMSIGETILRMRAFGKSDHSMVLALALCIVASSCVPIVDPVPQIAIYKTNGDYFDYYSAHNNKDGKVMSVRPYRLGDNRMCVYEGDTVYAYRIQLDSGYVLSGEVDPEDYFTNIPLKEIVRKYGSIEEVDKQDVENSIIDTDPFTVFYQFDMDDATKYLDEFAGYPSPVSIFLALQKRAEEINQDIKDGMLDLKYRKVK